MSNFKKLMMASAGGEQSYLALGQQNANVRVLDHNTPGTLGSVTDTQADTDLFAAINRSGNFILTRDYQSNTEGRIYTYSNGVIGSLAETFTLNGGPYACAWSPNDDYFAIGTTGGSGTDRLQIFSWNGSNTATLVDSFSVTSTGVADIKWHPDGDKLTIASGWSNRCYMLSFNGTSISNLGTKIIGGAYSLAYSPNGNQLTVSGSSSLFTYDTSADSWGSVNSISCQSGNQITYITDGVVARVGGIGAGRGSVSTFNVSPSSSSVIDVEYMTNTQGNDGLDGRGLDVTNDGAYLVAGLADNTYNKLSLFSLNSSYQFVALEDTFVPGGVAMSQLCFSNGLMFCQNY
jgi:hypothetical protein